MKTVKISDAKANLSRHLAYVRRGGRIRILDREVPIADLVPVEPVSDDDDDRLLAELERRGLVRRGISGPLPRELLRPGPRPRRSAVTALLDERKQTR